MLRRLEAVSCPLEGRSPAPPDSRQTLVPLSQKPALAPRPIPPTRRQTSEARRSKILHPTKSRPQIEKVRQNEKAEKYVPDEGTR